jgi:YggT family protein
MNAYTLYQAIHFIFLGYTILLTVRILLSWVPNLQGQTWVRFIAFYTDPYLGLFRRIIPPIGGMLDLSPILAFFALRILESMILGLFR